MSSPRAAAPIGGAGSPGGFAFGQPLAAAQLNAAFATKQDFIGVSGQGPLIAQTGAQLIDADLGTPSNLDLSNASGYPVSGLAGLGVGVGAALAQPVTGSGSMVLQTGPTLVAPNLGQPASADLTHATNYPVTALTGLGTGVAAALGQPVTGAGAIVLATNAVLTTPNLGTPSAINLANAVAPTQPPTDNSTKPASTAFVATATAAVSAGAYPWRNRLINGDMRIDQRHAGNPTGTPSGFTYLIDRWQFLCVQALKFQTGRDLFGPAPPPGQGFTNYFGLQTIVVNVPAAGEYFTFGQTVEGVNIADLMWGSANARPVVLSFWAKHSIAGTYGGAVRNGGADRSYPFSYVVPPGNVWTFFQIPIPGDTAGNWVTGNTTGLNIQFGLGVGTTFLGAANAWAAGNFLSPPGCVNVAGTMSAAAVFTGVQLEAGTQASAFERRPLPVELQLCQRYYCKTYNQVTAPGASGANPGMIESNSWASGQGNNVWNWRFPVTMRAAPTVTAYSINGTSGNWSWWGANQDFGITFVNPGETGVTASNSGTGFAITAGGIVFGHITADAEL